jgi:hypothetical protein
MSPINVDEVERETDGSVNDVTAENKPKFVRIDFVIAFV